IETAVAGKAVSTVTEGERTFDLTVRWPPRLRWDEEAILTIPVEVVNNQVTPGSVAAQAATPVSGGSTGLASGGTSASLPALSGSSVNAPPLPNLVPRRRLGDLVSVASTTAGRGAEFLRPGA